MGKQRGDLNVQTWAGEHVYFFRLICPSQTTHIPLYLRGKHNIKILQVESTEDEGLVTPVNTCDTFPCEVPGRFAICEY